MNTITRILLTISLLYLIFILASFSLSLLLPDLDMVASERDEHCYWTNAMVGYVECGNDLVAHKWRAHFYNFWLLFLLLPLFQVSILKIVGLGALMYSPLIFLIVFVTRALRQR